MGFNIDANKIINVNTGEFTRSDSVLQSQYIQPNYLIGPTGPKGERGDYEDMIGATGSQGPTGIIGLTGLTGLTACRRGGTDAGHPRKRQDNTQRGCCPSCGRRRYTKTRT